MCRSRTGGETSTLSSLSVMRIEQRGWGLGGISQDGLVSMSPLKAAVATKLEWTMVVSSARDLSPLPGPSWGPSRAAGRQNTGSSASFQEAGWGPGHFLRPVLFSNGRRTMQGFPETRNPVGGGWAVGTDSAVAMELLSLHLDLHAQ